jgi:hypothetical protein
VDIDQYEAPADGRREDYICKIKWYSVFSFQHADFGKSMMSRWKRDKDTISSWQSFVVFESILTADGQVEGSGDEFTLNSKDYRYILKPGHASRIRSIPFSLFQVMGEQDWSMWSRRQLQGREVRSILHLLHFSSSRHPRQ